MEETKGWLIRALLRMRLATWDVYNFAVNQAGLRTSMKALDWQTISTALRAKLRDIYHTLSDRKRNKSRLENCIKRESGDKFIVLKQLMAPWKKTIKEEKSQRIDSFKRQLQHLKKKQKGKFKITFFAG